MVQLRRDLYDPLLLSLRLLRFHGFSVSCIPLTLKRYCSPFIGFRTFIKFASCHTRPPFLSILEVIQPKIIIYLKRKIESTSNSFYDYSLIPIYTPGRKWMWGRGWGRGYVIMHRSELHCIVYRWLLISTATCIIYLCCNQNNIYKMKYIEETKCAKLYIYIKILKNNIVINEDYTNVSFSILRNTF